MSYLELFMAYVDKSPPKWDGNVGEVTDTPKWGAKVRGGHDYPLLNSGSYLKGLG